MPLFAIVGSVITQVLFLHGLGRLFLKQEADTYYFLAGFAGLASFITFHNRDGLPTWPAFPLLVGVALLTYIISIRVHRWLSR
jgi:hypothetical protein